MLKVDFFILLKIFFKVAARQISFDFTKIMKKENKNERQIDVLEEINQLFSFRESFELIRRMLKGYSIAKTLNIHNLTF